MRVKMLAAMGISEDSEYFDFEDGMPMMTTVSLLDVTDTRDS